MIEIKTERRPSGNTVWCQICGNKESKTLYFAPIGRETYGSAVHLCDNCLRELADKINKAL